MNLRAIRNYRRGTNEEKVKMISTDLKHFGRKQLFVLMNKRLDLPFQTIQL